MKQLYVAKLEWSHLSSARLTLLFGCPPPGLCRCPCGWIRRPLHCQLHRLGTVFQYASLKCTSAVLCDAWADVLFVLCCCDCRFCARSMQGSFMYPVHQRRMSQTARSTTTKLATRTRWRIGSNIPLATGVGCFTSDMNPQCIS